VKGGVLPSDWSEPVKTEEWMLGEA